MDFAYVTFVNNSENYLNLIISTINSVLKFSEYPIIVYLIKIPDNIKNLYFSQFDSKRVIFKNININLPSIYFYKPLSILLSLIDGLKSGYLIECDDIITPYCDDIYEIAKNLNIIPISPVHSDNVKAPSNLNIIQTQHYIHGHIAFNITNLNFIEEWFFKCLILPYFNGDEGILNYMYWKYNCKNHYLPIIDPYYTNFYENNFLHSAYTFHGSKNLVEKEKLFEDMEKFYTWWDINAKKKSKEIYTWIGDENALSKVYSRKHIYNKGYKSIIDLGCSNATMKIGFDKEKYDIKYVGVDKCNYFIQNKDYCINCDFFSTPFEENSFDIVFSRYIVEQLSDFRNYFDETIRLAKKEVLHIFFIKPQSEEFILYDENNKLFNNIYCKQDIEHYLNNNSKVESFHWYSIDKNEEALHINITRKKVISFCLWGDIARYNLGAIKNAELAYKYYPDFEYWFYIHKPTVPNDTINKLKNIPNTKIIFKYDTDIKPNKFMAWRFEPHDDNEVELFISRDTDTRILLREVLAVRDWIKSKKTFHIMRDSPCHYPVILGGMFGCRKINMFNMILSCEQYFTNCDNDDQTFLKDIVHPLIKDDCLIHDDIKKYEGECLDFPIKYDSNFHHVGEYVFEDEKRDIYYVNRLREHVLQLLPNRIESDLNIDLCLLACDTNSIYTSFYPFVKRCWKQIVGIETKLILVSETITPELQEYKDDIILFPPIPNIHTAFQAQCIRLLYPALLNNEKGIIISDMDLIPLNKDYFTKNLKGISEYKFVVYRNCIQEYKQYPICFCAANSKIWQTIFQIFNVNDIIKKIKSWYIQDYTVSNAFSKGWCVDQEKLYEFVEKFPEFKVILDDNKTKFNRLDRNDIEKIQTNTEKYKEEISLGIYSDFHLPRPYEKYEKILNVLVPTKLEHIFVLHYTKLKDRKESMTNQLKTIDFPITWVDQFDRENITDDAVLENYCFNKDILDRVCSPGEIANGIAHNYMIEKIAKEYNVGMIIEDDMIFKDNFTKNINYALTLLPNNWDILAVGGSYFDECGYYVEDYKSIDLTNFKVERPKTKNCVPTGCYILSKKGAEKICKHNLFRPFSAPIDENLCNIVYEFEIYWCKPWLAYEGSKTGLFASALR